MFRAAAPPMLVAASALIAAFWVAICAAAPAFIWQGLWLAWHHVTRTELLSALLVGFVFAFFVEPLMDFCAASGVGTRAAERPPPRCSPRLSAWYLRWPPSPCMTR
jgi:hypothetical protein